jgi:hypothetical protein
MGLFQSKPTVPTSSIGIGTTPVLAPKPSTNYGWVIGAVIGGVILLYLGLTFYNYLRKRQGLSTVSLGGDSSSGDKTPTAVDGKTKTTISAAELPGGSGSEYGVQYWMFIRDWDYKFGQEKQVLKRMASSGSTAASPYITLHPTDNSLQVRVSIFPTDSTAGASVPSTTSSTGDSFTCTVENVPLQSWFSVTATVFQRNLDIYINGRLVKSCVLPGVPRPISGDLILGDAGGFSGDICNVHVYPNMLGPNEAKAFFDAGTSCGEPTPAKASVDENSTFITLFGYTFKFSTLDKTGKELSSLTL